ncbi:MAG: biotin transporter BioY [Clostridia bacterium]|nr:biotin transporter BioY [Clostridia bacterium]
MKTKDLLLCAIFAAIIAVMSQISLPIGAVPFSMGIFGVMLCCVVLGAKRGMISVLVFILLGVVGLPVFAGFKAGLPVLAGPTGGYIIGYVFMSLIIGGVSNVFKGRKRQTIIVYFFACVVGTAVCYTLGTAQFMVVANKSLQNSLSLCVLPFILPDLIKCAVAAILGQQLKNTLIKSKILSE